MHRLDKDTSGLIVIAKNDEAHAALAAQIADKSARRIYHAIVHGGFAEDELVIDKSIGVAAATARKWRLTAAPRGNAYSRAGAFREFTHVEASLETGCARTRFACISAASAVRWPEIRCTAPKSRGPHDKGQLLHAGTLIFRHPKTDEEMTFSRAAAGLFFEAVLEKLRAKQ